MINTTQPLKTNKKQVLQQRPIGFEINIKGNVTFKRQETTINNNICLVVTPTTREKVF